MAILAFFAGYIGFKFVQHNFGEQGVYIGMLTLAAIIILELYRKSQNF